MTKRVKRFKDYSVERYIETRMAEHEVLLAFVDDVGAQAFNEWFQDAGSYLFYEWLEKSDDWNHLV